MIAFHRVERSTVREERRVSDFRVRREWDISEHRWFEKVDATVAVAVRCVLVLGHALELLLRIAFRVGLAPWARSFRRRGCLSLIDVIVVVVVVVILVRSIRRMDLDDKLHATCGLLQAMIRCLVDVSRRALPLRLTLGLRRFLGLTGRCGFLRRGFQLFIQLIVHDVRRLAELRPEALLRLLEGAECRVEFVQRGGARSADGVRIPIGSVALLRAVFILGQPDAQVAHDQVTVAEGTTFVDIVYAMIMLRTPEFVMGSSRIAETSVAKTTSVFDARPGSHF